MRFLVDTHVWLWLQTDVERVPDALRRDMAHRSNDVLLSAASAWEIAINHALGKLPLPEPPATYVPDRMRRSGTTPLPVEVSHSLAVAELPPHHRDPFDRLLVAQARLLSLRLVTADTEVARYDVDVEMIA